VIKDSVEFNGTWADDVDIFRVTPSAAELDAAAQAFPGSRRRSPSRRLAAPSPRSRGEAGTYPG
jgi:hypothetical protein